jgi:speckle-type POZ protein
LHYLVKTQLTDLDRNIESKDTDCAQAPDAFNDGNKKFFNSDVYSDFTIVCSDNVELPAHRCILAARTAVFEAVLRTCTMQGKTKKLTLNDIDSATMLEILRYIYTGKVQNLDKLASQVLAAADKYDLKILKTMCEYKLCNQLAKDNVMNFLLLADRYHMKKLEERCFEILKL